MKVAQQENDFATRENSSGYVRIFWGRSSRAAVAVGTTTVVRQLTGKLGNVLSYLLCDRDGDRDIDVCEKAELANIFRTQNVGRKVETGRTARNDAEWKIRELVRASLKSYDSYASCLPRW